MKKALVSIVLIGLIASDLSAQVNLDSLWTVWNDTTQPDTSRLNAIHKIAWPGYIYKRPDSAFYFAQMEFDLAEEKGLQGWMAKALNIQGGSYFVRGDFEKAEECYSNSLSISEGIGDKTMMAETFNNLGVLHDNSGDFDSALEVYLKGLEITKELTDTILLASFLNNVGLMYGKQGRSDLAIENYTECLILLELIDEPVRAASTFMNIGNVYQTQGEQEKAMEFLIKSVEIYEANLDEDGSPQDLRSLARARLNLGLQYIGTKEYDKAMEHFNDCLVTFKQIRDRFSVGKTYKNIARVHEQRAAYDSAQAYFLRSLAIAEKMRDKESIAYLQIDLSHNHRKKGELDKSIELAQQALETGNEIGALKVTRGAAKSLYKSYKKVGDHKQSLEMFELYNTTNDSITSSSNQRELMRQEYKYQYEKEALTDSLEFSKKEAVMTERSKKQQLGLFAAGGTLTLLLLLAFAIYRGKKRSDDLLLNILPYETAQELKQKGTAEAKLVEDVTVIFTDFKGFTAMSEQLTPKELVKDLDECFSAFDRIMEKHGIEKIKTIGDAYMAACGLPTPNSRHAEKSILAALEMRDYVERGKQRKIENGLPYFKIRIGVHTGPVVAGIVGIKKFQYDIWGDTVNTASRMESSGEVGKVNISDSTYQLVKDQFSCGHRGEIEAKGKGLLKMYFVESMA